MPETAKKPQKATTAAQKPKAKGNVAAPAKTPKRTPRRVFDQKVADIICICLSEGMSLRKILKADTQGLLPAQSTVYEWLLRYPEFAEQYTRAREEQADTLADEIIDIADEQPEIVVVTDKTTGAVIEHKLDGAFLQWQKNRIEARKWTAMKLKPKKYGERVALEGVEGGASIKTEDATASKFLEVIRNMEMTKRVG
jgi:DNA primase